MILRWLTKKGGVHGAGGQVINVLMAAIMGGYSLGQAAPNLEHFQTAKVAGGRIFELMSRQPDIDPDAEGAWRAERHSMTPGCAGRAFSCVLLAL